MALTENEVRYENAALADENKRLRIQAEAWKQICKCFSAEADGLRLILEEIIQEADLRPIPSPAAAISDDLIEKARRALAP